MTETNPELSGGPETKPIQVFVASPIGSPGSDPHKAALTTLNYIIRKALTEPRWKVIRADLEDSPDSIGQGVIRRILESDLIVVDLTDHNPNVFYELAIAHCYRKPVVLIATEGTRMPFDVVDQRAIFYDLTSPESVDKARSRLLASSEQALSAPDELVTPLTNMHRLAEITKGIESGDSDQLTNLLESVASRLAQIERAVSPGRMRHTLKKEPRVLIHTDAAGGRIAVSVEELDVDRLVAAHRQLLTDIAAIEKQQVDAFDERDERGYNEAISLLGNRQSELEQVRRRYYEIVGRPISKHP